MKEIKRLFLIRGSSFQGGTPDIGSVELKKIMIRVKVARSSRLLLP